MCPYELALKLHELGVNSESEFYFVKYDENNDKVDGVNVYYDQIDEVVYLVKIILEEMEGKDHGESS